MKTDTETVETTDAQDSAMAHFVSIEDLLGRIEEVSNGLLESTISDPRNWGIAGSLDRIEQGLKDILG